MFLSCIRFRVPNPPLPPSTIAAAARARSVLYSAQNLNSDTFLSVSSDVLRLANMKDDPESRRERKDDAKCPEIITVPTSMSTRRSKCSKKSAGYYSHSHIKAEPLLLNSSCSSFFSVRPLQQLELLCGQKPDCLGTYTLLHLQSLVSPSRHLTPHPQTLPSIPCAIPFQADTLWESGGGGAFFFQKEAHLLTRHKECGQECISCQSLPLQGTE